MFSKIFHDFDKSSQLALYKQIAQQIRQAVEEGLITAGTQLPGSRSLAEIIGVHRKTVIAAYQELEAEGLLTIVADKGTFIQSNSLWLLEGEVGVSKKYASESHFEIHHSRILETNASVANKGIVLTDGEADVRLAPMDKLYKGIRSILKRPNSVKLLSDREAAIGNAYYRKELTTFLHEERALQITEQHVMTVRGIEMGLYLIANIVVTKGDLVVVAELGNYAANMTFQHVGARLLMIPVDHEGIVVEALEKILLTHKIRAVYVTPHHHYPTTVTLSFERKLALLSLARTYGFAIIEDDQDYDYPYTERAQMPLVSLDRGGSVIYLSSFCKIIAPHIQAAYLIAPVNVINELSKLRRIIDHQSDWLMEQALGELLHEGEIQRHSKKTKKVYHQRRDFLSNLLREELDELVTFIPPSGGLAFWTLWNKRVNLMKLSKACAKAELHLPQNILYQTKRFSGMRLGFGNLSENELSRAVEIMRNAALKIL